LDHKLKQLIVYFLRDRDQMTRTTLVKCIYLFEYYYFQLFRKHYTNAEFYRYRFGPYTEQVVDATKELKNEGILRINIYPNLYEEDTYSYFHSLNTDASIDEYDDIPDDVRFVADGVLELIRTDNAKALAYRTPPMQQIRQEEEKAQIKLHGRRLDMTMTGPIYKPDPARFKAALKRVRQRNREIKPTLEGFQHEIELYHLFEDVRKRTNDAISQFEKTDRD